jgi:hypothetical protein
MSHRERPIRHRGMGTLADTTELWTLIGTSIVFVFLLVPGVLYAWFVLEDWIGDDVSFDRVVDSIARR